MKIQPVNINNNYSFQARKKEIRKADDIVRKVNCEIPTFSTSYANKNWFSLSKKKESTRRSILLNFNEKIYIIRENSKRRKNKENFFIKAYKDIEKYKLGNCSEKCFLTMGALSANGFTENTNSYLVGMNWKAIDKRTGKEVFSKLDDLDHEIILTTMTNNEERNKNKIIVIDPWLNKAMSISDAIPFYLTLNNEKELLKKEEEFISNFIEINKKGYGILGKKLPVYFNINDYNILHELTFYEGETAYPIEKEDFKKLGKVIAEEYPELILKDRKDN